MEQISTTESANTKTDESARLVASKGERGKKIMNVTFLSHSSEGLYMFTACYRVFGNFAHPFAALLFEITGGTTGMKYN